MPVRCLLNAHQMLKCKKTVLPATGKWYNAFTMGIPIPKDDKFKKCPDCIKDMPYSLNVYVEDEYWFPTNGQAINYRVNADTWAVISEYDPQIYCQIGFCRTASNYARVTWEVYYDHWAESAPNFHCQFWEIYKYSLHISIRW